MKHTQAPIPRKTTKALLLSSFLAGGLAQAAAAQEIQTGGTLNYRVASDPACVDPSQVRLRTSIGLMRQVVDSLTFQGTDGIVVPWLADSWEVSSDSTEYVFHIKQGVVFTDGTPLTARIVADNIQALKDAGAQAPLAVSYLAEMSSVTATEDETVVITFDTPQAQFLQASSTPSLGILAPATLETPLGDRCRDGVIGTGAFVLTSYTPNEGLTFEAKEDYSSAPSTFENQGRAYLDGIRVHIVPDGSVGTGMLLSGQVDYTTDVSGSDFARIQDAGAVLFHRAMPGFTQAVFINTKRGPLQDQAVRYALLHSIDRETLVPAGGSDLFVPATNAISPNTPGYANQLDLMDYDLDAAVQALDDAGWVPGDDGIRSKDGARLAFSMNYMSPASNDWVPFMELLQLSWAQVGIEMSLNPVSPTQDTQMLLAGEYDLRFNGLSRADPDVLTGVFSGVDPELDELLAAQAAESIVDARNAIIEEATALILSKAYIVPLNDAIQGNAYSARLHGVVYDGTNTPGFSGAWLSE